MHRQRGSPKEKGEWVGEEFKEGEVRRREQMKR